MGFFSIGKIIHGGVKIVKGLAEGDGEEIIKGAGKVASGTVGLLLGKDDDNDDDDDIDVD